VTSFLWDVFVLLQTSLPKQKPITAGKANMKCVMNPKDIRLWVVVSTTVSTIEAKGDHAQGSHRGIKRQEMSKRQPAPKKGSL
jgi:hypothetical protein